MSQQEFDNYLSLLCRLLRIAPQQREQVAEEFRCHMEDRLEELLATGMTREKAIQGALEEFGDAAGLAAQLVSISRNRRKRWVMRISVVSIAGLAAAGLLAVALWPEGARVPAPQVVAQSGDKPGAAGGEKSPKKESKEASVEEKLARRIDAEFPETPLKDVLEFLQERADIQIYVNRKAIVAADAEQPLLDAPITINLKQVRVDMILDLVLEQAGAEVLAYVERDGILIVSTSDALSGASEVKVYNCRDLLAMASPVQQVPGLMGPGGGMMPPGGEFGAPSSFGPESAPSAPSRRPRDPNLEDSGPQSDVPPSLTPSRAPSSGKSPKSPARPSTPPGAIPPPGAGLGEEQPTELPLSIPKGIAPQFGNGGAMGGGGMGGMSPPGMGGGMGMPSQPRTEEEIRAERLMHLITTAVKPDSWQDMGGFGTISEYKGLIVINHNARTHKEVENVLKMLREAAGLPTDGPMSGPRLPAGMLVPQR